MIAAYFQVRGTAGDPVLLGRVNLDGGDVILNGTRFVLTGGTVQFINPSETEPVVNMALTTSIQQYNINLRFEGPTNQLKTQYTSRSGIAPGRHHQPAGVWTNNRSSGQQHGLDKPDGGVAGGIPSIEPGDEPRL